LFTYYVTRQCLLRNAWWPCIVTAVRAALVALIALVLAACSAPPPSVSIGLPSASGGGGPALEALDSSFPAAGICDRAAGTVATFELKFDTPIPRCLKVVATQRLEVIDSTGKSVAVAFHGVAYILQPGERRTFEPTFGSIWLPATTSSTRPRTAGMVVRRSG